MSGVRLAVFDCDGTRSDGQAGVCHAMEIAFAEAGLPAPDLHQVRRIVGLSLPQAVRRLAPGATADQHGAAVEAYKLAFRRSRENGSLREPLFGGIAEMLHRSPKTIDNHRAAIMEKLDIHDRVELARYAIREGITEA